jgi:hypothetical protein
MRLRPALGLLLLSGLVGATLVTAAPTQAAKPFPGCRPKAPTVAQRAGGAVVETRPARVPCGSETGYYTGETGIAVHPNGDVWFSAADWEWAMVRSQDNGRTWQRQTPAGPQAQPGCYIATSPATCSDSEQQKTGSVADAFLYIDPDTGRLFWSKTYGFAVCSSLSITPDDGKTWRSVSMFACPGSDYEKIAGGPAPKGGEQPVGYPNVLYGCTNGPTPWFVVGPGRMCYKSLDGGFTWKTAGAPLPSPLAPGCLHFQEPQQVGPKGTLFLPIACSNSPTDKIRIGVSHDEGMTWSYPAVPTGEVGTSGALIGGVTMAVDKANTVYVVWRASNNKVYLAVSKDEGATWKGPMMVSMPGVTTALVAAQVVAQAPGHIAIGYYGYTGTTDKQTYNGYLTESFNASSASPLFHSAPVNDPAKPLYFPASGNLPRNDYLGVAMGPDGTPWAAFVKLKSKTPDPEGYVQSTGYAGRLARP